MGGRQQRVRSCVHRACILQVAAWVIRAPTQRIGLINPRLGHAMGCRLNLVAFDFGKGVSERELNEAFKVCKIKLVDAGLLLHPSKKLSSRNEYTI